MKEARRDSREEGALVGNHHALMPYFHQIITVFYIYTKMSPKKSPILPFLHLVLFLCAFLAEGSFCGHVCHCGLKAATKCLSFINQAATAFQNKAV